MCYYKRSVNFQQPFFIRIQKNQSLFFFHSLHAASDSGIADRGCVKTAKSEPPKKTTRHFLIAIATSRKDNWLFRSQIIWKLRTHQPEPEHRR
jgi:hypothetical protein